MNWLEYEHLTAEAKALVWNTSAEAPALLGRAKQLCARMQAMRLFRWRFSDPHRHGRDLVRLKRVSNETALLLFRADKLTQRLAGLASLPEWISGPNRSQFEARIERMRSQASLACGGIAQEADLLVAKDEIHGIWQQTDALALFLAALGEAYAEAKELHGPSSGRYRTQLDELQCRWNADAPVGDWERVIASIRAQISADRN